MYNSPIEILNIGIAYTIESFIKTNTPFHLVMETSNWSPKLPDNILENEKALFSFVNDTLKECIVSSGGMYLFINANGNNYTYDVNEQSLIFGIFEDSVTSPGKPGQIVFNRPEHAKYDEIDIEKEKEYSKNIFLSNPDNDDFFK